MKKRNPKVERKPKFGKNIDKFERYCFQRH